MTLEYISNSIDNKINDNSKKIIFSFYELKWKENLSEKDKKYFIDMAKIRLENMGYDVYLTGDRYYEDNKEKVVEINNEIIAIKKEEKKNENQRKNTRTKHKKIKYTRQYNKNIRR